MTTPDMRPGLNFGGGPSGGPNPFRITFFIIGVVFIILTFADQPLFFGPGLIFILLSFILKDGDGKGPGSGFDGKRSSTKDDRGSARERMEQSDPDGNPRSTLGPENS